MKQTILVTGGTGFIGSHTTVELQQAGYNVVIVDDLSNSKIEVLDGIEKITGIRPAFEQVDLRDKAATEAVFQKYPAIEGIIHFAASKAEEQDEKKASLACCIFTSKRPRYLTGRLMESYGLGSMLSRRFKTNEGLTNPNL